MYFNSVIIPCSYNSLIAEDCRPLSVWLHSFSLLPIAILCLVKTLRSPPQAECPTQVPYSVGDIRCIGGDAGIFPLSFFAQLITQCGDPGNVAVNDLLMDLFHCIFLRMTDKIHYHNTKRAARIYYAAPGSGVLPMSGHSVALLRKPATSADAVPISIIGGQGIALSRYSQKRNGRP